MGVNRDLRPVQPDLIRQACAAANGRIPVLAMAGEDEMEEGTRSDEV